MHISDVMWYHICLPTENEVDETIKHIIVLMGCEEECVTSWWRSFPQPCSQIERERTLVVKYYFIWKNMLCHILADLEITYFSIHWLLCIICISYPLRSTELYGPNKSWWCSRLEKNEENQNANIKMTKDKMQKKQSNEWKTRKLFRFVLPSFLFLLYIFFFLFISSFFFGILSFFVIVFFKIAELYAIHAHRRSKKISRNTLRRLILRAHRSVH